MHDPKLGYEPLQAVIVSKLQNLSDLKRPL